MTYESESVEYSVTGNTEVYLQGYSDGYETGKSDTIKKIKLLTAFGAVGATTLFVAGLATYKKIKTLKSDHAKDKDVVYDTDFEETE